MEVFGWQQKWVGRPAGRGDREMQAGARMLVDTAADGNSQ